MTWLTLIATIDEELDNDTIDQFDEVTYETLLFILQKANENRGE